MSLADLDGRSTIKALLGPTNTGKTHRAVRRMLGHRTGMIGLPLRLLAREVYDRVVAEVGEDQVALVTGEERRVPPRPRYWVSTTEAMPMHRTVDFLAVDEVQMAAHPERGHVFTDRILRARGAKETWFLGAETIEPLLRELVPTVDVDTFPRLSRLRHIGHKRLSALPARTAVVAFSANHVYELAERLRRLHGGTAVVLGALSPRTRNAQVALYQSGEVPVMVATDAIGMGLNMDIHHVALAGRGKFDGKEHRDLYADELAQIAGRAGRYKRDGTFGPTSELADFPQELAELIEQHRFPPLRRLRWRNSELSFDSLEDLWSSLTLRPPRAFLVHPRRTDDTDALERLGRHEEVAPRLGGEDELRLLWEVCQIPDFRKALFDAHLALLRQIFSQLTGPKAALDPTWMGQRLDRLDRLDGEVELLMTRMAFVRTWTYISHRADWVEDTAGWQERTRAIEDRLSDAVHERLTARFVDRRTMVLVRGMDDGQLHTTVAEDGEVRAQGVELGRLVGLDFMASPGTDEQAAKVALKAARQGLAQELSARIEAVVGCEQHELELADSGHITWNGAVLGRLLGGPQLLLPEVRLATLPMVGAQDRLRLERRLRGWARALPDLVIGVLDSPEAHKLSPAGRGIIFQLQEGLGVVPMTQLRTQLAELTSSDRGRLARLDVRLGRRFVYLARRFTPAATRARAGLWAAHNNGFPLPPGLDAAPASFPLTADFPQGLRRALGYLAMGPRAVRVDQAERVAARLRRAANRAPFVAPEEAMSWLGCRKDELPGILGAFGYHPVGVKGEEAPRYMPSSRPRVARSNVRR